jgi:nicotinamidase-related amidase
MEMRILKEKTAAVVIDFQERIFPAIHENEKLARNVSILIGGLKALEIPLFVTEQYVKGLGPTIHAIANSIKGIERIEKSSFSCCDEPRFMLELAASGKEFVVVTGIESHVCVLQTAIDLKHNGYCPIVVEDCISSRKSNDKLMAIERMRHEGIAITTYEAILFELLRYSGGETFKAISRLVK